MRIRGLFVLTALAVAASGCSSIEPWVKPYDRENLADPIMAGLKRKPRAIGGRCGACAYFDVCAGNTRVRALRITGDPWAEDPGCYLSDAEIGLEAPVAARVTVTPYRGIRHEARQAG